MANAQKIDDVTVGDSFASALCSMENYGIPKLQVQAFPDPVLEDTRFNWVNGNSFEELNDATFRWGQSVA